MLDPEIQALLDQKQDEILPGMPVPRDGKPGDLRTNVVHGGKIYQMMKTGEGWRYSAPFTRTPSLHTMNDYLLRSGGRMLDGSLINGYDVTIRNDLTLSALGVGHIPYINASGVLVTDNGKLVWDAANKTLGVGDSNPLSEVSVRRGNPDAASSADHMLSISGRETSYTAPFRAGHFHAERAAASNCSQLTLGLNSMAEDYGSVDLTNSTRALVGVRGRASKELGSGTVAAARAFSGEVEISAGASGATIESACVYVAEPVDVNDLTSVIVDACSFRSKSHTVSTGAITNAYGLYIEEQTVGGTINSEIFLKGAGEINFRDIDISIGSTLSDGILDISADASIRMFYDNADVGNNNDGQIFYVYRRAAEGDDYLRMYITAARVAMLHSSSHMVFQSATGYVRLSGGSHIYLDLGDDAGAKEVKIRDSGNNEVATIDSNGNAFFAGNIAVSGTVDGVDIAARDHAKYTGAEAISAVEGESTLVLSGILQYQTSELTIAAGEVTITSNYHTIDTQDDDASDELDTINGGGKGTILILQAQSGTRTVVIKHNTGNIKLQGSADYSMPNVATIMMLVNRGSNIWTEIARYAA